MKNLLFWGLILSVLSFGACTKCESANSLDAQAFVGGYQEVGTTSDNYRISITEAPNGKLNIAYGYYDPAIATVSGITATYEANQTLSSGTTVVSGTFSLSNNNNTLSGTFEFSNFISPINFVATRI